MSFDLATVAAELEAHLIASLPGINVRDIDAAAPTTQLSVTLTYEQLNISAEFEGQRLAANYVAVNFNLVLAAPEADPSKGTRTATAKLPDVCRALDASDQIMWSRADKGRDSSGTFYSIPVTLFAHYSEETTHA